MKHNLTDHKQSVEYTTLTETQIERSLFNSFIRHQDVDLCRRKVNGEWVELSDPFVDDWNEEEYEFLVKCLKHTIATGGVVFAAFEHGKLKGFSSVEAGLFGTKQQYMDLTSIHVSKDMRGKGVGKHLFEADKAWAKAHGAKKLYISAHSAVESQAFYRAMGCVEAMEYQQKHVEEEPCDCQLECDL